MKLQELIEIVHGNLLNEYKDVSITGFSTDTRSLKKGEVYIALKGKNLDGHRYIHNDLEASAIITEEEIVLDDIPVIQVKDTYKSLYYIANYIRKLFPIPLVAVTGSNGKTSLKELLFDILSTKYRVLKNTDNQNNIVGVFKTIKKLNSDYDMAILELGMNHSGEITTLSKMITPSTAVITNVGSSHIGNLKGRKQIYQAKMEITQGLTGQLILNGDDKYLRKSKGFKCGTSLNNDLIAYNIKTYEDKITFDIFIDKEYQVTFPIPSKYYVNTLLEAIKVGLIYQIDMEDILKSIKNYKPVHQRLNYQHLSNFHIIDDTYNANYESMKCGLEIMQNIPNDKIIILGDMLELGKYSKKYHKKLNSVLNKIDNKTVLTVGTYTKYIRGIHFQSNQELIKYLKQLELNDKYIYIKGSRRLKLEEIVNFLCKKA